MRPFLRPPSTPSEALAARRPARARGLACALAALHLAACAPPGPAAGPAAQATAVEGGAGRPPRDTSPGATGGTPNGPQAPVASPVPGPAGPTTPGPQPVDPADLSRPTTGLFGRLSAPARIAAPGGGGLASNNGSLLVANNGVAIVGNQGLPLLTARGGSMIGKTKFYRGPAAYRLAASEPQTALTQALLVLTNRDELFYRDGAGQVAATTVNRAGEYRFGAGYPVGKEVVVNAWLNDNLRMTGLIVPTGQRDELDLHLGSTLATELLRGHARRHDRSLASYALAAFRDVVARTQAALEAGLIPAVATARDEAGEEVAVARFDLRADHAAHLRDQAVIALSAAPAADAGLQALSDAWKALLGERPTAVTSILGSGGSPRVEAGDFFAYGFAEGDARAGAAPEPDRIPLGYNYSVAAAPAPGPDGLRHVFLGCGTAVGNSGHVRWLRLDAAGALVKATSLWLPTYGLGQPMGLCLEKAPTGDPADPGALLVADPGTNRVYRVYLVDEAAPGVSFLPPATPFDHDRDPATPPESAPVEVERHPIEIVAGEATPAYAMPAADAPPGTWELHPRIGFFSAAHPLVVDRAAYPGRDPSVATLSGWRAADEGPRTYRDGRAVARPARYAHLDQPWDVATDGLGNVYIADRANHRIRFIPSAAALAAEPDRNFFAYERPVYDADQTITRLDGTKPEMVAGALYTIAGNPRWDPARAPVGAPGWFGEYGGDDGPAQLARFDQPYALAWNEADQCLYVADYDNQRIRKISRATGVVTTVAGAPPGGQRSNGQGDHDHAPAASAAELGDGGPATRARLSYPRGLAFDRGRLYVADTGAGLIRQIDADGTIRTVAGRFHPPGGGAADQAEDGDARTADLYDTEKIAADPDGNLLLQDYRHGRLRRLWRQWER